METLTNEATNLSLNHSDTNQPSTSLGGGGAAVQNLDESNNAMQNMINNQMKQKQQTNEQKEDKTTQGENEQELHNLNNNLEQELEKYNKDYDYLTRNNMKELNEYLEKYLTENQKKNY